MSTPSVPVTPVSFDPRALAPSRDRGAARAALKWLLVALFAGAGAGALAASKPTIFLGLAGVAIATAFFLEAPLFCLGAVLVVRAGLDNSGQWFSMGGTNAVGVIAAATAFGGGLAILLRGGALPVRRVTFPLLAFLLLGAFSLSYSLLRANGFSTWLNLSALFVLFVIAVRYVRDVETFRKVLWFALAGAVVPVLVGLYQQATGGSGVTKSGFGTLTGTFAFSNGFAFFLLVTIALGIPLFVGQRNVWLRIALGGFLFVSSVCLFLTYTRSAWVAAVIVLVFMALVQYRGAAVGLAPLLVVLLLTSVPVVNVVQDRFADLSTNSVSYSTSSWAWRQKNWSHMLPYAEERPAAGWGLGSYPALTFEEFGSRTRNFANIETPEGGIYAHNDYLNMAVETGVPGMILWILTLLGLASVAYKGMAHPAVRPYASALFAVMVALIVLSFVDNIQTYTGMLLYPVVLIGALAGVVFRAESRGTRATGNP
jgi:O-antigen ligase